MAEAQSLINDLSEAGRDSVEGSRALARMSFAEIAQAGPGEQALQAAIAADPNDLHARHQFGALLLSTGREDAALEQFMSILKSDRQFEDDLGRRALIDAFQVIDDETLVGEYRRRMSSLLF